MKNFITIILLTIVMFTACSKEKIIPSSISGFCYKSEGIIEKTSFEAKEKIPTEYEVKLYFYDNTFDYETRVKWSDKSGSGYSERGKKYTYENGELNLWWQREFKYTMGCFTYDQFQKINSKENIIIPVHCFIYDGLYASFDMKFNRFEKEKSKENVADIIDTIPDDYIFNPESVDTSCIEAELRLYK